MHTLTDACLLFQIFVFDVKEQKQELEDDDNASFSTSLKLANSHSYVERIIGQI